MNQSNHLVRSATCLRLSQLESLQELSRQSGAPIAELIRRAIDQYLELAQRRGETGNATIDTLLR